MAGASQPNDLRSRLTPAHDSQVAAGHRQEAGAASLPTWLQKELHRAGVSDQAIDGLDEDAARALVAEIRSDELE